MKQLLSFIVLSALSCGVFAQKIKITDGIVYAGDSAYCKISGNKGIAAAMHAEFTVLNMQDQELIFINEPLNENYYEIVFLAGGQKQRLDAQKIGSNTKNNFMKIFYKNKLIENGAVSETAKRNFLAKYAVDADQNETGTGSAAVSITERNTDADIFIMNGTIKQDNKKIGSVKTIDYTTDNAVMMRRYRIFLPDNTQAAELTAEEFAAEKNKLVTLKDNRLYSLPGISGSLAVKEDDLLEKAVKYLVDRKYL